MFHVEDPRQRVADYAAVLVLNRATAQDVEVPIDRLGALVAAFLPSLGPEKLRAWSAWDMAEAVRIIKVDLLRHRIALREAEAGGALSDQEISGLDDAISRSVVASVFKFMTIRALAPEWYAPYRDATPTF